MTTEDTLTTQHVSIRILTEKKNKNLNLAIAFFVKTGKGKGKESKGDEKPKIQCNYCKKSGHKKDECWKRKRDEEKKKKEKSAKITA